MVRELRLWDAELAMFASAFRFKPGAVATFARMAADGNAPGLKPVSNED
jgi:hypothetical protein